MSKQPLPQMPRWDGPLSHPFYSHVVKRIIDFLFALILLIPGCIIMLPLAIWVKLDSPGPVLYKAVRGGYHNQPFYIYKFRSMVVGADKTGGCTALNDSRVTRAGKVMRRLKLDELPQLFNILKGDMSFVGPRPELLLYTTQYTKEQECILWVRPGITDRSSIVYIAQDEIVGTENPVENFEKYILPEKNRLRRTMMFMNAQKPGLIKDPYIYKADSLMLDLEDAVAARRQRPRRRPPDCEAGGG